MNNLNNITDDLKKQFTHYNKINRIANENGKNGFTTWLIKSLIASPHVTVVCKDEKSARELEKQYFKARREHYGGTPPLMVNSLDMSPRFVTVDTKITSSDIPIIFENHTLQYYPTVTNENFRSERQLKLFAILVGIWMSYNEVQEDIDTEVKTALITHSISQAKEYHFKDGWQNCTNYNDLKKWYLGSVSDEDV